jgi:hypothetical protein
VVAVSLKHVTVRILEASSKPQDRRELFIATTVSNRQPYVGEQVIYTWRFYRRVRIGGANLTPLEFEGLLVEDLGDVREYKTTLNGIDYVVNEIRKALFPSEEGTVTIPGSELTCEVLVQTRRRSRSLFDDFFGRTQTQTKMLRSAPIELDVRPLPSPPAGFSGLVGDFDITSRISKRQLQVGESATLELTISGSGNVASIGEPPMPDLSAFKIYDDKPTTSVDRSSSGLAGRKSFNKALVPMEPGELVVPPFRLVYFDPREGSYRTESTPALSLDVAPADGKEELRLTEFVAPTTGKVAVRILADDILPIDKGLDAISSRRPGRTAGALWLGSLLAPPLAFVGVFALRRRQARMEKDAGLRRRRRALSRALSSLRGMESNARGGDAGESIRLASRCVREYVGDTLGLEGAALTAAETDAHLRARGVDEKLVRETHELLDQLEAAQYGSAQASAALERLTPSIRALLKRLEKQIRRGS